MSSHDSQHQLRLVISAVCASYINEYSTAIWQARFLAHSELCLETTANNNSISSLVLFVPRSARCRTWFCSLKTASMCCLLHSATSLAVAGDANDSRPTNFQAHIMRSVFTDEVNLIMRAKIPTSRAICLLNFKSSSRVNHLSPISSSWSSSKKMVSVSPANRTFRGGMNVSSVSVVCAWEV